MNKYEKECDDCGNIFEEDEYKCPDCDSDNVSDYDDEDVYDDYPW